MPWSSEIIGTDNYSYVPNPNTGNVGADQNLGSAHTGANNAWIYKGTPDNAWMAIHQQSIPVQPNTNYTLTGWIRTSGNFPNGYFGVRAGAGSNPGTIMSEINYGSSYQPGFPYAQQQVSFNSGVNTSVTVYAGYFAPTGAGATWVQLDDVSIVSGDCLFCSGHSFLPDGRLLVAGGHIADFKGLNATNIFDFTTSTWSSKPEWAMNAGRWYPSNCSLSNGEVLTLSGTDESQNWNTLPQVWQTNNGGGWRSLTNAQAQWNNPPAGQPAWVNHYYPWIHAAPNDRIFMSGPGQTTGYLDITGTGSWTYLASTNAGDRGDDLGTSVMYDIGKVLIAGGGLQSVATNSTEAIDLRSTTPKWNSVTPMAYPREYLNSTILADGSVLITGGVTQGNDYRHAVYTSEVWNPATQLWSSMAANQAPRGYHSTALLLPDGRVLAGGSGLFATALASDNYPDAEIYSPPYLLTGGARPTIANCPVTAGYNKLITVNTPDAQMIKKALWVRLSSVTHAFNENQRLNYLTISAVPDSNTLVIQTPANASMCPPGHYMLFILNSSGVPSVARIVQIN